MGKWVGRRCKGVSVERWVMIVSIDKVGKAREYRRLNLRPGVMNC